VDLSRSSIAQSGQHHRVCQQAEKKVSHGGHGRQVTATLCRSSRAELPMLETRCEQSERLQLSKRIVRISEGGIAHLCEYMHGSAIPG
jgi:hypothetical protein